MKSTLRYMGGPVMPRSNSRAVVRSAARSGSSRWPIPGGATVAPASRSFSRADTFEPRFMLIAVCSWGSTWIATKVMPTASSDGASDVPSVTAPTSAPVANANTAGSSPHTSSRLHQVMARPRWAWGSTAKNCQGPLEVNRLRRAGRADAVTESGAVMAAPFLCSGFCRGEARPGPACADRPTAVRRHRLDPGGRPAPASPRSPGSDLP